ncbi:MAG: hypothetical protein KDI27_13225 [Gammaproteobacteria bacterium]|nr:hypothetical protein [Gammaproteobacteria bacterium]
MEKVKIPANTVRNDNNRNRQLDYALARKDLVAWLRKQLLGPAASSDELLRGPPR